MKGRGSDVALAYREGDKEARREILLNGSCEQAAILGYMRRAVAGYWKTFEDIRRQPGRNKLERAKRKANYYHALSVQIPRIANMQEYGKW